ncbi:hypothetical protein Fcan01_08307 [Folsomia candida]|uniref:Odorant receptor n=2 Tax=Folsomia candida TaxID=158441 RepID=A0A226EKR9_FOLCA|nr:hypothetical protein Fcan01_08307 [Folsomia candida]
MIRKKALQRIPSASEGNEGCKMLLRDSPLLQQMFTNLVPYIKIQIKVCSRFSCIPFTWDEEQRRIGISKSRWKLRFCKFQVIIHWIYTLAMLAYFVTPGSMKLNKMSNKLLGFVFLSCLIVTMFMQSVFWQKRTEAIALWKAFSDIEEYYIDPSAVKKSKRDPMSLVMILLGICTSFGLPGFMCTMLLVDPCKPPHLGYILYKVSLETCMQPKYHIRILLLMFDTWIWAIAISSACYYVFHCMFLGLRCLDLYMRLLITGTRNPLQRIFRTQDSKDQVVFRLYREFQIVVKFYNKVFQTVFIPTLVATAIFVIIICLYTCIKLHKVIPMPGFAFFPLLSTDGFSVIFISRIASIVYIKSRFFVTMVQNSSKNSRRTWFRKNAASLDKLKIRFGSGNFIDEMTPLVFLDFSFSQTVSLMLLT